MHKQTMTKENMERNSATRLRSVRNKGRNSAGPSKVEEDHCSSNPENVRKMDKYSWFWHKVIYTPQISVSESMASTQVWVEVCTDRRTNPSWRWCECVWIQGFIWSLLSDDFDDCVSKSFSLYIHPGTPRTHSPRCERLGICVCLLEGSITYMRILYFVIQATKCSMFSVPTLF